MEQEIINLKQQIIDLKVENYNLKMELKELMPKKDYKKLEQTKVINCKTC
jgi:regulator of replication initiation timing